MKKLLALTLVMMMTLALFAACGQGDEVSNSPTPLATSATSTPSTPSESEAKGVSFPLPEAFNVEAFVFSKPGYDLDKSLFMEVMQERTNVVWELAKNTDAEIVEKMGLSFNTGDYYDVYMKCNISEGDAFKYGSQGIILPLNDLINQYMPNLKKALDERDLWGDITSSDGKIYALPQIHSQGISTPTLFFNQPWVDAVGKKMPTNEQEFIDLLRAFRDGDPNKNGKADEYPLYLPGASAGYLMPYWNINMDWGTHSMFNHDKGEITFVPSSAEYKKFLADVASMYSEKLINQDTFTASWEDLGALGKTQDVVGMFPQWGSYLVVGPEKDENFPMLMGFHEKSMPFSSGVFYGALAITDKCERPEVICAWADYLYSEEGSILAGLGVEGKTYKVDSDGNYDYNIGSEYGETAQEIIDRHIFFGNFNIPYKMSHFAEERNAMAEERFLYGERVKMRKYAGYASPVLTWSEEETKERADLYATIIPFVYEYQAAVMTGQKDLESTWDEYIASMEAMNVARLKEIDKGAYERWLEAYRAKQ